jgi:hypothetical protein
MKEVGGGNVPGGSALARRTLGKKTSFAGPYLSCSARAIARPSAEDRIPSHGCTNMHSALELVTRVGRVSAGLSRTGALLKCSRSMLGEPALCATAESARAWRRSICAVLLDLGRDSIGELKCQ